MLCLDSTADPVEAKLGSRDLDVETRMLRQKKSAKKETLMFRRKCWGSRTGIYYG